jgi:hypothetical protein
VIYHARLPALLGRDGELVGSGWVRETGQVGMLVVFGLVGFVGLVSLASVNGSGGRRPERKFALRRDRGGWVSQVPVLHLEVGFFTPLFQRQKHLLSPKGELPVQKLGSQLRMKSLHSHPTGMTR